MQGYPQRFIIKTVNCKCLIGCEMCLLTLMLVILQFLTVTKAWHLIHPNEIGHLHPPNLIDHTNIFQVNLRSPVKIGRYER